MHCYAVFGHISPLRLFHLPQPVRTPNSATTQQSSALERSYLCSNSMASGLPQSN
jgi:hypothetical protein